jgi:hypothetical protein
MRGGARARFRVQDLLEDTPRSSDADVHSDMTVDDGPSTDADLPHAPRARDRRGRVGAGCSGEPSSHLCITGGITP